MYPYGNPNDNKDLMTNSTTPIRKDFGPNPFVTNIEEVTKQNTAFRSALWTGKNLQMTLMSLQPGEEIGLEQHPDTDQFLRVEDGHGWVAIGDSPDNLQFKQNFEEDYGIFIPAGTWHNIKNTGNTPLKLYSIYAPPHHPSGTLQQTKEDAQEAEAK